MGMAELFSVVSNIKGVQGYILIDRKGNIVGHDTGSPEILSKMVYSCGKTLFSMANKNFKYASFSRQSKKDILIFQAGRYFLGVIKQPGIKDFEAAEAVMEFLTVIAGKRLNREAP